MNMSGYNIGELPEDINIQGPTKGPPPAWWSPYIDPGQFTVKFVINNGQGFHGFGADEPKDEPKKDIKAAKAPISLIPQGSGIAPKPTAPSLITPKETKVASPTPVGTPKPTAPPLIKPKAPAVAPTIIPIPGRAAEAKKGLPKGADAAIVIKKPIPEPLPPKPAITQASQNLVKNLEKIRPRIPKNVPLVAADYTSVKAQSTMFNKDIPPFGFGDFSGTKMLTAIVLLLGLGGVGGFAYYKLTHKKSRRSRSR